MAATVSVVRAEIRDYPQGGVRFDTGMALCLGVFLLGGFTDGWAHNNIDGLDSFFTPWHAVLYGAAARVSVVGCGHRDLRHRRRARHGLARALRDRSRRCGAGESDPYDAVARC